MPKTKYLVGMLLLALLAAGFTGCYPFRKPAPPAAPQEVTPPAPVPVPDTAGPADNQDYETAIEQISGVKGATVVRVESTILVGIDLPPDTAAAKTASIKAEAIQKVRTVNPAVTKVAVTADPDLVTRIRNVAADIKAGKPIAGLMNEITAILQRISPAISLTEDD